MSNYTLTDTELLRRLYEYSQKGTRYDPDNAAKGHRVYPGSDERDTFLQLLTSPDYFAEYLHGTPNRIDSYLPEDPAQPKINADEKIVILGIDDTHSEIYNCQWETDEYPEPIFENLTPSQLLTIGIACISGAIIQQHNQESLDNAQRRHHQEKDS
ncbi:hypothetical protein CMUST_15840 (plasmid) [Corynebacterium mustelae]|uniref:Uncharacterized protein n=1 Tax=Corynebacterium mustelae TaxID=571915 RepID=A0A0G3H084_9CORY|nr:hypothetical protein [Corynebacterium mustelae]AKK05218.1 hypothetical protein CMUST_04380 [Corynebacterium mustelae]AKK07456.1 hypothetical protein CMUST_15840 [Corynebacterium mustelae]